MPSSNGFDPRALGALCHLCPLAGEARPVPPELPPTGKKWLAVLVGEAPGQTEENQGRPFVGRTGIFLESLLRDKRVGLKRENLVLTNAALCRGTTDKDNEKAAQCCAPRLLRELASYPPNLPIVAFGKSATLSILGNRNIMRTRGFIFTAAPIDPSVIKAAIKAAQNPGAKRSAVLRGATLPWRTKLAGRTVLPALHPAFILRSETWKPVLQADLRRISGVVKGQIKPPYDDEAHAQIIRDVPGVRALWRLRDSVSLDLETDGLQPLECKIRTVQISDGRRTFVIFPWKDAMAPGLTRFLLSRKEVVGHNIRCFDEIVLHAHGVDTQHKIAWVDTLIAHHAYASHLRQGLDHVVSVYQNARPWKLLAGKHAGAEEKGGAAVDSMTAEQLISYGAADALLTAKIWQNMQEDLQPEIRVFKYDMRLSAISRDMQIAGIGFDRKRQIELLKAIDTDLVQLTVELRALAKNPNFSPRRIAKDVRHTLFTVLGAPRLRKTPTGEDSTGKLLLESLAPLDTPAGKFARALIRWRVLDKVRGTYVADSDGKKKGIRVNPVTKRIHYNWKPFGTVSGRLSCRLQSAPRYDAKDNAARVRELYIPRSGNRFVYFDVGQAEMRLAAYLSNDPVFIEACEGDIHANNAKKCFLEIAARGWLDGDAKKDPARGKKFRDLAKSVGFAISYFAETDTVFARIASEPEGEGVTYVVVDRMLSALRRAYRVYFAWVHKNFAQVQKCGFMRTPFLGRIRWLGWHPKITEVANFPIQSGLADLMNERTIEICRRLPSGVAPVAQVHDALMLDTPRRHVERVCEIVREVWARPVETPGGKLVFPIDLKVADRWSELG